MHVASRKHSTSLARYSSRRLRAESRRLFKRNWTQLKYSRCLCNSRFLTWLMRDLAICMPSCLVRTTGRNSMSSTKIVTYFSYPQWRHLTGICTRWQRSSRDRRRSMWLRAQKCAKFSRLWSSTSSTTHVSTWHCRKFTRAKTVKSCGMRQFWMCWAKLRGNSLRWARCLTWQLIALIGIHGAKYASKLTG